MGNDQSGFEAGDVIYRKLIGSGGKTTNYTSHKIGYHYGIYIGNDTVIAFTKEDGILKSSLDEFAAGHEVSKERVNRCHSKEDTVQIATYLYKNPEKWGEYSFVFNNCEHFAKFCATGVNESSQVNTAVEVGVLGLKIGIVVGKAILDSFLGAKEDSD